MNPIAIYIHIPYCLYKCHYCDFNSYPTQEVDSLESEYVNALLKEIEETAKVLLSFISSSIYFGGGTPSLFSPQAIGRLIKKISEISHLQPNSEITLEVNPKTVSRKKIKEFMENGVNRFSIGVQSFQDRYLTPLGRLHTGQEAIETLKIFKEIEVNFNIDLMFGFPNQTVPEVIQDLEIATGLESSHLSFYNLTLEKGTLLAEQERRKQIRLPENEIQAEMYEEGIQFLEEKGYPLYEVSNFSIPKHESRHNLAYWRYQDYIGFGAGAVSFLQDPPLAFEDKNIYGIRWKNPLTPKEYVDSIKKGGVKRKEEKIDFSTAQGEFWMMGLRLKEGVSIQDFKFRFGKEAFFLYQEKISSLISKNWMVRRDDKVFLTEKGRLFTNEIVSEFFI